MDKPVSFYGSRHNFAARFNFFLFVVSSHSLTYSDLHFLSSFIVGNDQLKFKSHATTTD